MSEFLFSGTFNDINAEALYLSLRDLQKIGCNQFAFHFTEDNKLKISAVNESKSIISIVSFNDEYLDKCELSQEFKFGVYNSDELVSFLSLFKTGFELLISPEKLVIKVSDSEYEFYSSNLKTIRKAPECLSAPLKYIQKFDFDPENYKPFIKAIPLLNNEFILLKGSINSEVTTLVVTEKDIKSNSFNQKIVSPKPTEDFKLVVNKQHILPILASSSFDKFIIGICKDMVHIDGIHPSYTTNFYIKTTI
jgi:hypothetical protein